MNPIQIVGKQFDNMPAKKLKNLLNDDLQSKEYQVAVLTMVRTYGAACAAVIQDCPETPFTSYIHVSL